MSYHQHIPQKIVQKEEALRWVVRWKMLSRKVVFTNGVFDILHRGHVEYLMEAADLGNELIIGLNSDASAKGLGKGANRPIQDEVSRAMILASLAFVSAVVIFDEDTPENLIKTLSPDVLVKGGDYTIDQIAGSAHVISQGGEVKTIPFVDGYSTTAIESRIRKS